MPKGTQNPSPTSSLVQASVVQPLMFVCSEFLSQDMGQEARQGKVILAQSFSRASKCKDYLQSLRPEENARRSVLLGL